MAGLGDFISGPIGQLLLSIYGGQQQQQAYNEAKAANEGRYQEGLGILDQLGVDLGNMAWNQGQQELDVARGNKAGAKDAAYGLANRVGQGAQDRTSGVIGYLQGQFPGIDRAYGQREGISTGYGQDLSALGGMYSGLSSDLSNLYGTSQADLGRAYDALQSQTDALMSGLGGQQKADIDTAYKNLSSQSAADLMSRGVTGTTVAPSVQAGIEKERSAEQRRLQDDLTRQRLENMRSIGQSKLAADQAMAMARGAAMQGVGQQGLSEQGAGAQFKAGLAQQLTGDTLANRQNTVAGMGNMMAQLTGDELASASDLGRWAAAVGMDADTAYLNSLQRTNDRRYGTASDLANARLGWIGGRTDTYPSQNWASQLAYQYGQNSQAPPEQETDWFSPTMGAAGSIGGAFTMATILAAGVCIDADARLKTKRGPRSLRNLKAGDYVLCADGNYHKCLQVAIHEHEEERWSKHKIIGLEVDTLILWCTPEHVVGGKPAGEWKVGEEMKMRYGVGTVSAIHSDGCVTGLGDVLMENAEPYVANQFVVSTMLAETTASKKAEEPKESPFHKDGCDTSVWPKRGRPMKAST